MNPKTPRHLETLLKALHNNGQAVWLAKILNAAHRVGTIIRQSSIVTRVFRTEAAAASAATRGTSPDLAR